MARPRSASLSAVRAVGGGQGPDQRQHRRQVGVAWHQVVVDQHAGELRRQQRQQGEGREQRHGGKHPAQVGARQDPRIAARLPGSKPEIAGLLHERRHELLEHIEVHFLRSDANAALHSLRFLVEVVAVHANLAAGFGNQRGDNADGGGFACPVRPQQRVEFALAHGEVDSLERLHAVGIHLGQALER